MKDTKFTRNTFQRGITMEEHYGTENRHHGGVRMHGGVEKPAVGVVPGVAVEGNWPIRPHVADTGCHGITVKGLPCKAYRVKGEELCIGHLNGQRRDT